MTVEWTSNGWVATGVPCFDKIEVNGERTVLHPSFTYSEIHGKIMPQAFDAEHLAELRDALTQALAHMASDNDLRVPRQWWNVFEDPPVPQVLGTEVTDCEGDIWTLVSQTRSAETGQVVQEWTRLDKPSLNFRDASWNQIIRYVPLTEVLKGEPR